MLMAKRINSPSMKVFQNFTSKFPEKMVRDEDINRNRKVSPSDRSGQSPGAQLRTYWTSTKMLLPDKTKTSKTNEKHKTKTRTKLKSAKNRFGLLGLTARETEVLTLIAQGKTNHEIGVILSASTGTICKHVEHILCKLDVKNRTAAAVIALATLARAKNLSDLR
jgi:ATP/maltotriose-dependent transcriptional regulator MalT